MNAEWHDLIQKHLAGLCSEDEAVKLQQALSTDETLARLYLRYSNLEVALEAHSRSSRVARDLLLENRPTRLGSGWLRGQTGWLFGGAAALLWVSCTIAIWSRHHAVEQAVPIAEVLETTGARWKECSLPTQQGSLLASGKLSLAEGIVRLAFKCGAEVTLEGPSDVELVDRWELRLLRGAMVAHVPKGARGFSVQTPHARVIDHGTDFAVTVEDTGQGKVQVMQGEVEVQHCNGQEPLRLSSRERVDVTAEKLLQRMALEPEPRRLKSDRTIEEERFSNEITTRSGRGDAAYVAESRTGDNQSASLLLLKHCQEEGYGRKVLLRFDLHELPDSAEVHQARLTVSLGATGYGFASRGGDARIGVYALTREEEDDWSADRLSWESQPAFDASAGKVNQSNALRIGEFTIPRGVQTGTFWIEDERLAERIRLDGNRLLTLILVRENAIEEDGGLVLGIAGNRHDRLAPPRLSVR